MSHKIGENNFDLIRLLAASQVALLHVLDDLAPHYSHGLVPRLLELFPGVPIFFFISGFLISRAYEKTAGTGNYLRNRALRIFPALHVCVALNILAVFLTGYFGAVHAGPTDVLSLYLAKTTFFQFYNPDFMRRFGDGVLNGSLWTICVELQFYLLTPVIYKVFLEPLARRSNIALLALIAFSLICNRLLYATQAEYGDWSLWKLARVSFAPWFYMFLCGTLAQRNFQYMTNWLRPNLIFVIVPAYIGFAYMLRHFGFPVSNALSPIVFAPLALMILTCAFANPGLSRRWFHGHDISYGIYIYHVPVMNMFLYYGFRGSLPAALATLGITVLLALASWLIIERPSLQHKRRSSHPIQSSEPAKQPGFISR